MVAMLIGIKPSMGEIAAANRVRGTETFIFKYDGAWLVDPDRFSLEPALALTRGGSAPPAGRVTFGSIGDSAPDTWGRLLMQSAVLPNAKAAVAILSAEQDPATVQRALAYGASGYIPKSIDLRQMAKAILLILSGEIWSPFPLDPTTPPALRVAHLPAASHSRPAGGGKAQQEDRRRAQRCRADDKVHVSTILRKLGVMTRTQAAILAERLTRKDHRQNGSRG